MVLDADGPGNTYELITSVLAPGSNPIEVPDCNHAAFGEHIDEFFDTELNVNVFRFFIHTSPDNDRCLNFDRQRNEIKSYDKSPDNLLGVAGEKVAYKWKFKLDSGFQSSPNFTHLHQLKSVGGSLASMPMYTLTTRKGNPDQLELRYAETDRQVTLTKTSLAPFIGTWLEVSETIEYGASGSYEIEIKRLSDGAVLMTYADDDIINWRPGAEFVRPKWGIYRSLQNAQDLRDETVSFANFSIEELGVVSSTNAEIKDAQPSVFFNPANNTIWVKNLPQKQVVMQLYTLDGKQILVQSTDALIEANIDISAVPSGAYILNLKGARLNYSKLVLSYSNN
ncbi:MAG: hypothetical protein Sapg2KO_21060 [Saprospiraceae bacterium]